MRVSVNDLHIHGFAWPKMDSHKCFKWFGTYTSCKCKSHNEIYFIPCKTV